MTAADDEKFMTRALELSRRHAGLTGTNPSVGCVIVKDGEIVGEAVTAPGGRPHAEAQALAIAGDKARGATVYVTLEPCSHYGKTPPCANALVEAGVARVVTCLTDPDPRVSGRGLAILEEAGIIVENGLMEKEGRRALASYLMRQTKGRPHVTLKLAVSADGMLGRPGEEVAITGLLAKDEVHRLRAQADAILVGIGTVLADDPELTVRIPGMEDRSPTRIVLDRRLVLPLTSNLVRTAKDVPVIAVAGEPPLFSDDPDQAVIERREALRAAGVETLQCDPHDLELLLGALSTRGISSILVEGGAAVAKSFLNAGLVDRILLFQGTGTIDGNGLESPVVPSDIPDGFELVGEAAYGPDRTFEYERVS
ncbi:bifunctional diaminohydroxyphosphoribosylaminopyrimidine deaminase/5-amino-6-(5-phosphoribosylamino)uracil reductase RibD [Rhizobium sp. YS-1r]|uniref:bifunctional diaminohydroxyphosphoribosylaminopyrimidine deaminase/5-amino-6-(5-phosphoribosylamino)uracil reductase RibD n=1 Tax=Rhizobium sp. YS-1r TaxID=1532558 RepID=UPI0005104686|nr:bifunctional diaminohydroxyphosphoribosylaminopyrimidine deaminase/5-amino-6-(5-phosphoribosylamino)uracil reductase RibD [Rhizobium sp. YS-1r]KGD99292.1 5-amino-6-(5-phosphoribosylamino)uracil reductase [Rhizobium sp. YS-1r]